MLAYASPSYETAIVIIGPSRESMLAYASPSYETAIVIIGLVNNCLGQFRTQTHHYSTLAIYNI